MKIIDSHVHLFPQEIKNDKVVAGYVAQNKLNYTQSGLLSHMDTCKVDHSLIISNKFVNNGYTIDLARRYPKKFSAAITLCGEKKIKLGIQKVLQQMKKPEVRAIKFYLGYEPIDVRAKVWHPLYREAIKRGIAAIFHTGDTLYDSARLKYTHPLLLDDLAVDFSELKIVIAHFGNPWLLDAAEVVYKNKNVYADISGLFTGAWQPQPYLVRRIVEAIEHCDPEKLMFGSDYPVARMDEYLKFANLLKLSKTQRDAFFWQTAARLYKLPV